MVYANPFPIGIRAPVVLDGHRAVMALEVRPEEPFFAGHFPSHPVVPGVLLLQLMRETAQELLPPGQPHLLRHVEGLKLLQQVEPGTRLVVLAEVVERTAAGARVDARVQAGEVTVARARITLVAALDS
jgi:3-hydroxyacyl-[acyl-carrier-protein] dehydratase